MSVSTSGRVSGSNMRKRSSTNHGSSLFMDLLLCVGHLVVRRLEVEEIRSIPMVSRAAHFAGKDTLVQAAFNSGLVCFRTDSLRNDPTRPNQSGLTEFSALQHIRVWEQ